MSDKKDPEHAASTSEDEASSSSAQGSTSREDYAMTGINKPGVHDVLCGRGGGTNNHEGNIRFRKMVAEHKIKYLAASKVEKPKVARQVVKEWRALDPPGRFLARADGQSGTGTTPNADLLWDDVGDKKAREKASQCLRERTADVLPFVHQMKQKQQLEQDGRQHHQQGQHMHPSFNGVPIDAALLSQAALFAQAQNGNRACSMPPSAADGMLLAALDQHLQQAYAQEAAQRASAPPNSFSDAAAANADHLAMPPPPPVSMQEGFANFNSQEAQMHLNSLAQQDDGEMTLDEYRQSLQEFIAHEVPQPDESPSGTDERAAMMQGMRRDSWVRSFHSVESDDITMDQSVSFEKGDLNDVHASNSTLQTQNLHGTGHQQLHGVPVIDEQSATDNPQYTVSGRPAMPEKGTDVTRSQKSQVSMFSDISDMSGMMSKSSRYSKMGAAKTGTSNLSLMSELTDLSNNLSVMELSATGGETPSYNK